MSEPPAALANAILRLYQQALRVYPEDVRREYAGEMQAVFALHMRAAARQGGRELLALVLREARDLPPAAASAHFRSVRGHMNRYFPSTSDQTPWAAALLSLLPFFLSGPVRLILFYTSGWGGPNPGSYYIPFVILGSLLMMVGFGVGAACRFPRWAYLYVFALPGALAAIVTSTASLYGVQNFAPYGIFLFLIIVLALLWLPGLRSFYRQIGQDWTLLSYGLYVVVLLSLGGVDRDESPSLNAQVLLPSLIGLAGALTHLRIRDPFARMVALLAALLVGMLAWLEPVMVGMINIWASIGVGLMLLVIYGGILAGVLLAPMLVNRVVREWRKERMER